MSKHLFLYAIFLFIILASCTSEFDFSTSSFKSDNADLASLSVSNSSMTPSFSPSITNYVIAEYVSNGSALVAIASNSNASIIITPSVSDGSNYIRILVTSEDGSNTNEYRIKFYRMGADYTSPTIGALKYVPAGAFQRDATVANISFVSAQRMSQTEITRSQYSNVMGADPSEVVNSTGTSDPVQNVNWYHAIAFCNKLSISEGLEPVYSVTGVDFTNLVYAGIPTTDNATWNAVFNNWAATGYRLPTEMEWMWAAMGAQMGSDPFAVNTTGYSKPFAGSTGSNSIDDYAWYILNSGSMSYPAGGKLPNELGLADMSGNVFEWCWDWYGTSPTGYQADFRGAASGPNRVIRGGSWNGIASYCAVASRINYLPSNRNYNIGFRVVRP